MEGTRQEHLKVCAAGIREEQREGTEFRRGTEEARRGREVQLALGFCAVGLARSKCV